MITDFNTQREFSDVIIDARNATDDGWEKVDLTMRVGTPFGGGWEYHLPFVVKGWWDTVYMEKVRSSFDLLFEENTSIRISRSIVHPLDVSLLDNKFDMIRIGLDEEDYFGIREMTGIGISPIQLIGDCARPGMATLADFPFSCPGDMAKAFAAGADFVTIGPSMQDYSLEKIIVGLKRACAYAGVNRLRDFYSNTRLITVR